MNKKIENVDEIVKIVMENEDVQEALRYAILDKHKEMAIRERGFEEGAEEEKITIAKRMKKDGIDIETIVKYSGLTKEEIEKL